MPFNATTYRMNRHRKDRDKHLAAARDVKARAAKGEAYDWEIARIASFLQHARISNHLFLTTRRIKAIEDEQKAILYPHRKRRSK